MAGQSSSPESQHYLPSSSKFYINLVNMVFMLGFAFGGVLLAARADEFGRKPVMLFSLWLTAVSSIAITWSPNVKVYIAFRFIHGV